MLRKGTWILFVFMFIFSVSACNNGSNGKSQGGTVNISFLTHWSPPQVQQLKDAIKVYHESHPNVNIEVRAVPFGNLLSTLTTQSTGPKAPTIASIYDLWLPELQKSDIVTPAPDSFADDISSHYPSNLVSAITIDNKIYGYPNEVDLYALNYNEKLFEEVGISGPPKTWDELLADAKKLTKKDSSGKVTQQGFGLINSWNSGVVHPWLSMIYSNGGVLLDTNHHSQLNTQQAREVTEFYQKLIKEGYTVPSMGTANASTTGPYLDNFANGKTGMIIMANWWESALSDTMGDDFKYIKTAPIPIGPSGDSSHSVSYSWLTVVNKKSTSEQQKAAWEFLKWLNSEQSGKNGSSAMGDILMGMGIIPSRTSDIEAHQDKLNSPFIKTYVDELKNAKPFPIVLAGNELTTNIQKKLESMEFGQSDAGSVMKDIHQMVNDLMDQNYNQ